MKPFPHLCINLALQVKHFSGEINTLRFQSGEVAAGLLACEGLRHRVEVFRHPPVLLRERDGDSGIGVLHEARLGAPEVAVVGREQDGVPPPAGDDPEGDGRFEARREVVLVGEGVAEGIGHGDTVDELEVLHDVRVSADDGVGPVRDQPAGEVFLVGVVLEDILHAPVREHQHEVRSRPGLGHHRRQGFAVLEPDLGPGAVRPTVGAVGEIDQRDGQVLHLDKERVADPVGRGVQCGAGVRDAQGVEHLEGAPQARGTLVQHVVVGCQEDVEAHVPEVLREVVRPGEGRVAGVRLPGHREFQVPDGHIGALQLVFDVLEETAVAVLLRTFGHRPVADDVADDPQGDGVGGVFHLETL